MECPRSPLPARAVLRPFGRAAAFLILFGAAACGGGGDTSTSPGGGGTAPTIALSASTLAVAGLGSTGTLTASVTPSAATVTWSSSNTAVATVTGTGPAATITAIAGGTAQITATATNGTRSTTASASVTVTPVVRGIQLAESSVQLLAGGTQRLTPTVTADAGAARTLQWRSDDVTIATVDTAGVVTAIAAGNTTVRVSAVATPAVTAAVPVRVTALPRVRGVVVAPTADSAFVGQSRTFTATVTADSGLATTVIWRSSTPSVATVDGAGRVTTLAAGSTTLTAIATADTTVRATATLTVRAPAVRSVSLSLPASLAAGRAVDATVVVTSDPGADARLAWSSSAPSVATVDANGRVIALAAGTTTITVRSVAFTTVSANAVITVTTPPTTSVFTELPVGSGGGLTTARITDIFVTSATQGIVFADASAPNIPGASAPLQLGSPVLQLRSDLLAPFVGRFGSDADGSSPSDVFWSLPGNVFSITTNTALVLRWNGSTLVSTNWPLPSGSSSPHARALSSIGVGEALALSSTGGMLRYRGGAWSTLVSTSPATSGTGMSAWTGDSAVITRCRSSATDPRVAIFRAGTVTFLPNTTLGDDPTFFGCGRSPIALAGGDFIVALDRTVARYSDGTFTPYTPTLDSGEWFYELTLCGSTLYAGTSKGRIFRASGTSLSLIADVGLGAVGSTEAMSCTADGTLRVGSDDGLLTRWNGSSWTDEHYAPRLGSVSLQAVDAGLATGSSGSIWRWNGSQWNWLRRNDADNLGEAFLAPDGTMFVGGSTFPSGGQVGLLLRSSGAGWVRDELARNEFVRSLWGASSSQVFAVVSGSSSGSRILRFDGTGWSAVAAPSTQLLAVHGTSASFAIATGRGGVAVRWDGSSWSALPAVPVANSGVDLTELLTLSPTLAYAGAGTNACDSFTPGGLWRWNGTAWADAGLAAAGFSSCVRAVFGTGANDVFAIVRSPFVAGGASTPDQLVRWNGSAWTLVPVSLAQDYTAGAAIPGLTMLVGKTGRAMMGTVPGAVRLRTPSSGAGAAILRRRAGF